MSLKIFACGDVVNFTEKSDFIDINLKNVIQSSDLAICNLEAPIKHDGMQGIKKAGPHLYQSKKAIQYLNDIGFNFVSLANNHIYDFGQPGIKESISELKKFEIDFIGGGIDFNEAYKTKVVEKNSLKIGLIAACENEFGCLYEKQDRGGYAWLFHDAIEDNIKTLKKECDFIILIAHAGVENIDFPIKEWRDRYKRLCEIGVDVVVGHHPHVPQGFERHKDALIFYSLGNFYFDTETFEDQSDDSYSVILDFNKNQPVDHKIIYHKKIHGQTCLVDEQEVSFDLNALCDILHSKYDDSNNAISLKLFNQYYYNYYEQALESMPVNTNILKKIKWLVKRFLFSKDATDNKNLLLLHNIRIDTHRFVVQRALSLMSENKADR